MILAAAITLLWLETFPSRWWRLLNLHRGNNNGVEQIYPSALMCMCVSVSVCVCVCVCVCVVGGGGG